MNIPIDRHVPAVAEPITRAQPTNYADILKELEREQQQQQPQPSPPVPIAQQPPPQQPPPQPVVQPLVQPPAPPLPVDKGPLVEDSFFVRYRRHLFVAAVAFAVLHYASPYLGNVSYLSNGLVRSAATAALIAGLFYAGDVFILSPETILEVAR
jgi:hypothetical protein